VELALIAFGSKVEHDRRRLGATGHAAHVVSEKIGDDGVSGLVVGCFLLIDEAALFGALGPPFVGLLFAELAIRFEDAGISETDQAVEAGGLMLQGHGIGDTSPSGSGQQGGGHHRVFGIFYVSFLRYSWPPAPLGPTESF